MLESILQGVCTEAGMYALRERRVHVTQEDFELAVAKVWHFVFTSQNWWLGQMFICLAFKVLLHRFSMRQKILPWSFGCMIFLWPGHSYQAR